MKGKNRPSGPEWVQEHGLNIMGKDGKTLGENCNEIHIFGQKGGQRGVLLEVIRREEK